jgi:small subunit ribosomal protein S20
MRQAERRAIRNRAARSAVRTYVKKAGEAVLQTAENAAEVVRAAVSALDKAAHKGIVHPNAAARRKSRLMGRLHALAGAPSESAKAAPKAKAAVTAAKSPAKRATAAPKAAAEKKPAAASAVKKPAARKPAAKPKD